MGLNEAKADLFKNVDKLAVHLGPKNEIWRLTKAGSSFVILRWGYKEGSIVYEVHTHGTYNPVTKTYAKLSGNKVCGAKLTGGESYLTEPEWALISKKVRSLV